MCIRDSHPALFLIQAGIDVESEAVLLTTNGNSTFASLFPPRFSNFTIKIPDTSAGIKNSRPSLCVFEPVLIPLSSKSLFGQKTGLIRMKQRLAYLSGTYLIHQNLV